MCLSCSFFLSFKIISFAMQIYRIFLYRKRYFKKLFIFRPKWRGSPVINSTELLSQGIYGVTIRRLSICTSRFLSYLKGTKIRQPAFLLCIEFRRVMKTRSISVLYFLSGIAFILYKALPEWICLRGEIIIHCCWVKLKIQNDD